MVTARLWRRLLPRRYRVVRQYDQADCGPAALLTVLRYWGGDASLARVRQLARTDVRGSSMLSLVQAAGALGLEATGAAGDYDALLRERLPCIAHVVSDAGLQHFVVVFRIAPRGVLLGDPGRGLRRLSRAAFLQIWRSGAVVLLAPTDRLARTPAPRGLPWIAAYFDREQTWLVQSLFLGALYTGLGLLTAVFVQWLIDRLIPARSYEKIFSIGLALLTLLLLRAGAGYLRQRFVVELNKRVGSRVNADFLSRVFRLPLRFFDTRSTGDITARVNDAVKIQSALLQIVGTAVIDGLITLGSLGLVFAFAPPLGWVALAAVPAYGAILARAVGRVRRQQNDVMRSYAGVEASYIDGLTGIEEIIGFNAAAAFAARSAGQFAQFQDGTERLGRTQAAVSLQAELAGGVLIMGGLVFGAVLVIRQQVLLGQMIAAYSLLGGMLPSIHRLVDANISLQGAAVAVARLMDLMLVDPEPSAGRRAFALTDALEVRRGRFVWPRGRVLLQDLDMRIPRGRITGLWGPSGAGKSTVVRILQRKYALTSGALMVDGAPAEEIELSDYRRNVGVVPEHVKVFRSTLADNVLLGRLVPGRVSLEVRLSQLGVASFLDHFEAGLRTPVGEEGQRLSAGERQIVGLLRALLEEPALLVVDEGVNALDAELASRTLATLRHYAQDHAVLIIAHNLGTLLHSECLYVLEGGRIAEQGTPAELIERGGRFAALWRLWETSRAVAV